MYDTFFVFALHLLALAVYSPLTCFVLAVYLLYISFVCAWECLTARCLSIV